MYKFIIIIVRYLEAANALEDEDVEENEVEEGICVDEGKGKYLLEIKQKLI